MCNPGCNAAVSHVNCPRWRADFWLCSQKQAKKKLNFFLRAFFFCADKTSPSALSLEEVTASCCDSTRRGGGGALHCLSYQNDRVERQQEAFDVAAAAALTHERPRKRRVPFNSDANKRQKKPTLLLISLSPQSHVHCCVVFFPSQKLHALNRTRSNLFTPVLTRRLHPSHI